MRSAVRKISRTPSQCVNPSKFSVAIEVLEVPLFLSWPSPRLIGRSQRLGSGRINAVIGQGGTREMQEAVRQVRLHLMQHLIKTSRRRHPSAPLASRVSPLCPSPSLATARTAKPDAQAFVATQAAQTTSPEERGWCHAPWRSRLNRGLLEARSRSTLSDDEISSLP